MWKSPSHALGLRQRLLGLQRVVDDDEDVGAAAGHTPPTEVATRGLRRRLELGLFGAHERRREVRSLDGPKLAAPGGQGVVRPHALQPAERQALGGDRGDHTPIARGRPRRTRAGAQEDWDVVRLPAIAEADELHRVETVFGRQCFGRKAGEALQPEREPPEMLAQLRRTLGEYNFAGQYQ